MNFKLVLAILSGLAAIAILAKYSQGHSRILADPIKAAWTTWKQSQNKSYGTDTEEAYRFGVFTNNYNTVSNWNNANNDVVLALNQFADLETKEFAAMYTGLKKTNNLEKAHKKIKLLDTSDLPDNYDARTDNLVTAVKNQGQCGSCWAFSAVAAVEGALAKAGHTLTQYSEQQVVDCDTDARQQDGNMGCNGGEMNIALEYIKNHPIMKMSDYPYTGRDDDCHSESVDNEGKITSHAGVAQDPEQIKAAIYQHGPVSVGIEADSPIFQFYLFGVISSMCGENLDHGVTAVGWGKQLTLTGEKEYFLVKNSWGSMWGRGGYVKIGVANCGIQKDVNYAVASA
jgi:C1A family cysteine protease